jgi:rRNA-processing protein FCF1
VATPVPNPAYAFPEIISTVEAVINLFGAFAPSSNPHIDWAVEYTRRISQAELLLRDRFIGQDLVWPSLNTERARQIAGHNMTAPILVNAEVDYQRDRLRRIINDLKSLELSLRLDGPDEVVIPDTNVFIHSAPIDEIDWAQMFPEPAVVRIVILHIVLDELDKHSHSNSKTLQLQARAAIQKIDELRVSAASPAKRVKLRDNVSMQILADPPLHDRCESNDAEFMLRSQLIHAMTAKQPTILTIDRGMIVRAHTHQMKWERAKRADPPDAKIKQQQ